MEHVVVAAIRSLVVLHTPYSPLNPDFTAGLRFLALDLTSCWFGDSYLIGRQSPTNQGTDSPWFQLLRFPLGEKYGKVTANPSRERLRPGLGNDLCFFFLLLEEHEQSS